MKTMKFIQSNVNVFFGHILVIDPCYIIPDKFWSDYCNKVAFMGDGHYLINGKYPFFQFNTAHGDGCYPVRFGKKLVGRAGVDAGLLSFFPEETIKHIAEKFGLKYDKEKISSLGVWIEETVGTVPYNVGEGSYSLGAYSVVTS